MGEERRLATLLVFVQALERTATDDILDLFDGLLTALALQGETKRRRERLRSLKDLDHAALVLQQAVRILLDETVPDGSIRQRVLGRIGEVPLRAAADAVQALASSDDDPQFQALSGSYATVRRFLPALLNGIAFEGSPSAKPLLDAWHSFLYRPREPAGGTSQSGRRPPAPWCPRVGRGRYFLAKAR